MLSRETEISGEHSYVDKLFKCSHNAPGLFIPCMLTAQHHSSSIAIGAYERKLVIAEKVKYKIRIET